MAISQLPTRLELWWMIFLIPAMAYSSLCSRLGTSLGYFAMQLRLLDASGQLPVGKVLILRECFRTIVFWLFLGCVVALDSRRETVFYLMAGVFWTVFFVDIAAIVLPGAACLHDLFLKTRVVLRRAGR